MTEQEIKDKYRILHDVLSEAFYNSDRSGKEDFDTQHGQNWVDMEAELIAEGYMEPPKPPVNLLEEIAILKDRLNTLEMK